MAERFYQTHLGWSDVNGHENISCALHEAVLRARQLCQHPKGRATVVQFGP